MQQSRPGRHGAGEVITKPSTVREEWSPQDTATATTLRNVRTAKDSGLKVRTYRQQVHRVNQY